MGIIFRRTLKCESCGYEYRGKYGGHVIANGEHYSISQYYCKNCHSIIDLECYSSLRENAEKYFFPDGTEVSYNIEKQEEEISQEKAEYEITGTKKELPPFCPECGSHLFKFDIDNNKNICCPECGNESMKQAELHVVTYVD